MTSAERDVVGPLGHRRPDPRHRRARIATAAGFAAQGLMFTALLTHLPQFTDRYAVSEGTVTLIVLMVTLLAGVGSLLSELLAARTSSRTALRCGLLVIAVAGAAIGVAPEFVPFVIGFAVYGVGLGAVDAAVNMQGVAVQHRYGRSIITSFHAAWSGAAIAGALYVAGGELISVSLPVSILPVAAVVLAIQAVAGPQLLPVDDLPAGAEPAASVSPAPSASAASPAVPGTPGGPGVSVAPRGESDRAAEAARSAVALAAIRNPLFVLGLAMTCFWAVDAGVSNWSSLYLRDVLTASDSTAALGYALYQATALTSRLVGDLAVQQLGAVRTVRLGAVIGTLGAVLVVLAPGPVVAIIGFGLAGLGLPMIAPLCFSAAGALARARVTVMPGPERDENTATERDFGSASDISGDAAVNRVVARLNVFNYLGSLLGAVVVGGIATASDLRIGFIVPALLAATVFFLARAFAPAEAP